MMRTLQILLPLAALLVLFISPAFSQTVPTPAPREPVSATPKSQAQVQETDSSAEENEENTEPKRVYQTACPAVLAGRLKASISPPLIEGQCGERSPLNVTEIANVKLSSPAILNCQMATALADWFTDANQAALASVNSKITQAQVSTTYQCRRRNNALTGKISEHGFANAIDLIGFRFADGTSLTLLEDWGPVKGDSEDEEAGNQTVKPDEGATTQEPAEKPFLYELRDIACEHFTTVLSPDTNALHADHFHFDLGCHGKRCTYRLCE
jgi:hypothetical protein